MSDLENRMAQLEQRLARLEQRLSHDTERQAQDPEAATPKASGFAAFDGHDTTQSGSRTGTDSNAGLSKESAWSATLVLGWAGATAIVLAAVYFIRLAIDAGWLTPTRQISGAVLSGLVLIVIGMLLRQSNRQYASLLPAGGVVILFLSIYGAHHYYALIGPGLAATAVVTVCIASLWLGRHFASTLYALFAVVGSYSAPFLLPHLREQILDLIIYYTAWSLTFSFYAVLLRLRAIYLLALYMALVGFDVIWQLQQGTQWIAAVTFQFIQFIIFAAAAAIYSIKQRQAMSMETALAHLPALLIFYIVQYALLHKHMPELAPWIAAGSLAILALCYGLARRYMTQSGQAARLLLAAYAALILLHAGYLESVPSQFAPWLAIILLPILGLVALWRQQQLKPWWPILAVVLLIFAINYLRVVTQFQMADVPGRHALMLLYSLELYLGYYFSRRAGMLSELRNPLLYAGHLCLMAFAIHFFDSRILISMSWGFLALACLLIALRFRDKMLGQSSMLLFAAAMIKVFLYDLAGSAAELRVVSLLVLGVTLYIGGWLYQKVKLLDT